MDASVSSSRSSSPSRGFSLQTPAGLDSESELDVATSTAFPPLSKLTSTTSINRGAAGAQAHPDNVTSAEELAHQLEGEKPVVDEDESDVEDEVVLEKYENGQGGSLTSLRPSKDYEMSLRLGREERRRKSGDTERGGAAENDHGDGNDHSGPPDIQLVSGRQPSAGWERSGIRFAPLNIPLKRRLQVLVVLFHCLSPFILLTTFFWFCAIPFLWPIIIPYLIYILASHAATDGLHSSRSPWLRRKKIWSLFGSYFPARLHRTAELDPERRYLLGYHPHGIISHGAFAAFATDALGFSQLFPGIDNALVTLDSNFRVPFYREYLLRMGMASVARHSCENMLSRGGSDGKGKGRAVTIVVGGAREALEAIPGTLSLVLKSRFGFIKLAVRMGADLVPVMGFGENDIYDQVETAGHPYVYRAQLIMKKVVGFTMPLFHARGVFNYDVGILPYRRPINIVVGRPIRVTKQEKVDEKYVAELHAQYMRELTLIWDTWKDVFAKDRVQEIRFVA